MPFYLLLPIPNVGYIATAAHAFHVQAKGRLKTFSDGLFRWCAVCFRPRC
ncbi:hypothetical protein [Kingella potus]|nr:hypothetical protein [Kingella potus]UOP01762.1 hypothetical protein LVJ84_06535 [Kingella potus]